MFDQKTRRALFLIAFGVCLYAAMMHLDVVLGALSAAVDIFFPVLLGLGFAFVLNVPVSGMERLLHRAVGLFARGGAPRGGRDHHGEHRAGAHRHRRRRRPGRDHARARADRVCAHRRAPCWRSACPKSRRASPPTASMWKKLAQFFQGAGASSATAVAGSGAQGLLNLGLGSIASSVFAAARSTISVLSSSVFAFVIAVYVLASKCTLGRQVNRVMDAHLAPGHAARIRHVASLATDTYSKFLSGQCLEACILGTLIFLAFSLFRLPYAGLIGFLTALFAFVPYVGAFASCAIGAFLTLLASPEHALLCVIVYLAVQFIENQFIYPHVVGSSVGLSALWTLIAALVGGKLFGIVGIVFFIPIVAVLYELFRQWTNARLAEREARGGAAAR